MGSFREERPNSDRNPHFQLSESLNAQQTAVATPETYERRPASVCPALISTMALTSSTMSRGGNSGAPKAWSLRRIDPTFVKRGLCQRYAKRTTEISEQGYLVQRGD